jgi:hypothetical protein
MLRVAFLSSSERHFQAVMKGLSELCERVRKPTDKSFTVYNVTYVKAGQDNAAGVDMVEIHDDMDGVFSGALDQVCASSI